MDTPAKSPSMQRLFDLYGQFAHDWDDDFDVNHLRMIFSGGVTQHLENISVYTGLSGIHWRPTLSAMI